MSKNTIVTTDANENFINFQELSSWRCELFGTGPYGIVLTARLGHVPNFFWRFMQYVCFGNKWINTKKENKQ